MRRFPKGQEVNKRHALLEKQNSIAGDLHGLHYRFVFILSVSFATGPAKTGVHCEFRRLPFRNRFATALPASGDQVERGNVASRAGAFRPVVSRRVCGSAIQSVEYFPKKQNHSLSDFHPCLYLKSIL